MPIEDTGLFCRGTANGPVTTIVPVLSANVNLLVCTVLGYEFGGTALDFSVEWGDGTNWQAMTRISTDSTSGQASSIFQLDNPNLSYDRFRITFAQGYSNGGTVSYVSFSNADSILYSNTLNNDTGTFTLQDTVTGGAAGDDIVIAGASFAPAIVVLTGQSQVLLLQENANACSSYFWGLSSKDYSQGQIAEVSGDFPSLSVISVRYLSNGTIISPTDTAFNFFAQAVSVSSETSLAPSVSAFNFSAQAIAISYSQIINNNVFNYIFNPSTAVPDSTNDDYGRILQLPNLYGSVEFTEEDWLLLDDSYPYGPVAGGGAAAAINWANEDPQPPANYADTGWWFDANFYKDGHNNNVFRNGTDSLTFYGEGRVRWMIGDGTNLVAVQAYPATNTSSLRDGSWHLVTRVRRFTGAGDSTYELWVDGILIDSRVVLGDRTDYWTNFWQNWTGFVVDEFGQFHGGEKQSALGKINHFPDYKGLVSDNARFNIASSGADILSRFNNGRGSLLVSEPGLVSLHRYDQGSGAVVPDSLGNAGDITLNNINQSQWVSDGGTNILATSALFDFQPQAIDISIATVISPVSDIFSFIGLPVVTSVDLILSYSADTFNFQAQPVTVSSGLTIPIASSVFSFDGQAVVISSSYNISPSVAQFNFQPQLVDISLGLSIIPSAALFNFQPQQISVIPTFNILASRFNFQGQQVNVSSETILSDSASIFNFQSSPVNVSANTILQKIAAVFIWSALPISISFVSAITPSAANFAFSAQIVSINYSSRANALNDAILEVTGGPTVNDGLLSFYLSNGAITSEIDDAELEFLIARGVTNTHIDDAWRIFLSGIISINLSGSLNDMKTEWWINGAPLV